MSSSRIYDAVVIGGGVIGCAIAYELAKAGVSVAIFERDAIGSGASGAAAGMLAPQSEADEPDIWFRWLLAARDGYEQVAKLLESETGVDVEYRKDGVLRVALDQAERLHLEARCKWQRQFGLAVEWLEPAEARKLEPSLTEELFGALWLPNEAQVRPTKLVEALRKAGQRHGAVTFEGEAVVEIARQGDRVSGLKTSKGSVAARIVILAAGAWSGQMAGSPPDLPVRPVKGQILSVDAFDSVSHIVWGEGAYLAPKMSGELFVGATMEEASDTRPTAGAVSRLVSAGTRLVPGLDSMTLQHAWAGLRPASPDRLPLIGPAGEAEGLFVATGHFRNGILLGPATGAAVAKMVLGQSPEVELAAYGIDRFAVGRRSAAIAG